MPDTRPLHLTKHHGAGNDFLVLVDADDRVHLDPDLVRALCDRRFGVGADGVIRVVRGGERADLAMDLRNADGSVAEMTGNGMRCLAQAAVDAGLVEPPTFTVSTLAGVRTVEYRPGDAPGSAEASVDMGRAGPGPGGAARRAAGPPGRHGQSPPGPPRARSGRPGRRRPRRGASRRPRPEGSTWSSSRWAPGRTPSPSGSGSAGWGRPGPAGPGARPPRRPPRTGAWSGSTVEVHNPGGTLQVSLAADGVRLSGPVQKVADVEVDPRQLLDGPAMTPGESAFTDTLISRSVRERIVLVGVTFPHATVADTEAGLDELALLVDTAGADVMDRVMQRRSTPDPATYLGRGKAEELLSVCLAVDADTVVFDDDLSPAQQRNLEKILGRTAIDRTAVILDIFAQNARTPEGRAQVELALLRYRLPRLRGRGRSFSQQAGGIGTRGPGETKLEVDRRRLVRRMTRLESDLRQLDRTRRTQRRGRSRSRQRTVSLVGYTNAGKSTLLNRLCRSDVLVEDRLFSTLDPRTRQLDLPGGETVLMTDTVGFVRKLPHQRGRGLPFHPRGGGGVRPDRARGRRFRPGLRGSGRRGADRPGRDRRRRPAGAAGGQQGRRRGRAGRPGPARRPGGCWPPTAVR